MKKYQRMHLIFIRQYIKQIMEYKVDFVVGVLGVFLTQGLNPLISQCHLSTHPIPRRLDFSRNCLYLWFFLDS